MSPSTADGRIERLERIEHPVCTSTPVAGAQTRVLANGHDAVDNARDAVDDVHDSIDNAHDKVDNAQDAVGNDQDAIDNAHDAIDNAHDNCDVVNGNVNINIVSESTNSMDVLSGGESDAGDTLSRKNNNNSISSGTLGALRESTAEVSKRRVDVTYFVAKELLMTERTYKRDLELVTVTWSRRVSELAGASGGGSGCPEADVSALARAALALEPLALRGGALLARLERALAAPPPHADPSPSTHDSEEPEYKKVAEILHDHLSSTYDAYVRYVSVGGALAALVESVRRGRLRAHFVRFERHAPLPLALLLLRPLHRLLHYRRLAHELQSCCGTAAGRAALALSGTLAAQAQAQLPHAENHAALCQLQRDILGYDKLLVAGREFIRLGCLYKHSTKGLQQRMLFLFSDVLIIASKPCGSQFRAHAALPLRTLQLRHYELPHSFQLIGEDVQLLFSASNDREYAGWCDALETAIDKARDSTTEVDTELTPYEIDMEQESAGSGSGGGGGGCAGSALAHVCWHRAASLHRHQLHQALRTQLSGYLLRKFKKSPGWQKLWVVFAAFTLFFYKSWQDEAPLASLPLLGYSVGPPDEGDGIDKEFVFKLQFKNHVYFFRADSLFTYNRWTEVLQTATVS